jgi:hypothetical protein
MLCGAVCPSSQGTIVALFVIHCLCFGNEREDEEEPPLPKINWLRDLEIGFDVVG